MRRGAVWGWYGVVWRGVVQRDAMAQRWKWFTGWPTKKAYVTSAVHRDEAFL